MTHYHTVSTTFVQLKFRKLAEIFGHCSSCGSNEESKKTTISQPKYGNGKGNGGNVVATSLAAVDGPDGSNIRCGYNSNNIDGHDGGVKTSRERHRAAPDYPISSYGRRWLGKTLMP